MRADTRFACSSCSWRRSAGQLSTVLDCGGHLTVGTGMYGVSAKRPKNRPPDYSTESKKRKPISLVTVSPSNLGRQLPDLLSSELLTTYCLPRVAESLTVAQGFQIAQYVLCCLGASHAVKPAATRVLAPKILLITLPNCCIGVASWAGNLQHQRKLRCIEVSIPEGPPRNPTANLA
jgi:hypothetical protein